MCSVQVIVIIAIFCNIIAIIAIFEKIWVMQTTKVILLHSPRVELLLKQYQVSTLFLSLTRFHR